MLGQLWRYFRYWTLRYFYEYTSLAYVWPIFIILVTDLVANRT